MSNLTINVDFEPNDDFPGNCGAELIISHITSWANEGFSSGYIRLDEINAVGTWDLTA